MPISARVEARTLRDYLYAGEGVSILGVGRGVRLDWLPDEDREEVPTPRVRRSRGVTTVTETVLGTESVVARLTPFQRRQAIRRALATVFDYSNELVDGTERLDVIQLRLEIMRDGSRAIHNGNLGTLRSLLKSHPISHVERMTPDELKAVVDALVERDTLTIETCVSQASTRRS